MTTTVVKTIGSGGDYTSLQAWNDAAPASLVTADEVWEGQCLTGFSVSGATGIVLTIGGSTTDATRYKILTTAAGAAFRDNPNALSNALTFNPANGVSISGSSYNSEILVINEAFARVNNLQVQNTSTTTAPALKISAANVWIDGLIVDGQGGTFAGAPLYIAGAASLSTNLLVVQRSTAAASAVVIQGQSSGKLVNCTVVVPSDLSPASFGLIEPSYSSGITVENCALFGGVATSAPSDFTFITCANEHTSPPTGVIQVAYNTTTGSGFEATTNSGSDFRIKSTSALIDAATADSADAPVDILGTSRPQGSAYDIGAVEFKVAPLQALFNSASTLTAALTTGRVHITPAWATGAIGEWQAIPGTAQTGSGFPANPDSDIGSNARLTNSGMAMQGATVWIAASGGHTDYHGNEVGSCDLSQPSPVWVTNKAASNPLPNGPAYAADGAPAAAHRYWTPEYVASINRIFLTGTRFTGDAGNVYDDTNGFDPTTNDWDPAGTWTDSPNTGCMDDLGLLYNNSDTDDLYVYDPVANTYTDIGHVSSGLEGNPICFDPVTRLLLVFCWGNGQASGGSVVTFFTLNTSGTIVNTPQTMNSSAAFTAWQALATSYQSMVYDPNSDTFLVFAGAQSNSIFVLSRAGTNTWDMSVKTVTGASLPTNVGAGSYNRFRYSEDLQGIVYMPSGAADMMFLRLAGAPYSPGSTGTAAATQAPNTASGTGAVSVSGSGAATQAKNTGSASGAVSLSGSAAATQHANMASAAGSVVVAGSGAATQAANTAASLGAVTVSGSGASTQAPNTCAAVGTVTTPGAVTGTASATQQPNTAAASGSIGVSGSAASTQGASTGAAAGAVTVSGAAAGAQAPNACAASGTVSNPSAVTGTGAATQAQNAAAAAGAVGGITGAAAAAGAPGTCSAFGRVGQSLTPTPGYAVALEPRNWSITK